LPLRGWLAIRMAEQSYFGIVKSFNPEKGWGHIECDETHALYGKDIFLLRSQFVGMESVSKGDQVYFMVQDGHKGIEACNIQQVTPTGAYNAVLGSLDQVGPSSTTCTGTVKSWNPEKGWGHIECSETHALFGKDVFLMRSHLVGTMDVNKGQQVSFSHTQGTRGPEAANVQVLSGSHSPNFSGGGNHAMMGAMGGLHGQNAAAMVGMASTQAFTGLVKSFNEEKGWGHISCDATRAVYQKDMFFMRSALEGGNVMIGDTVQFGITVGIKGPEASSLMVLAQPMAAKFESNVDATGQMYSGTIKMYNAEKGWGFLVSDESQRDWGKDIFVHSKEFAGILPQVGDVCNFYVTAGKDGRPEAYGVMALAGGGVAPVATRGPSAYFASNERSQFNRAAPY